MQQQPPARQVATAATGSIELDEAELYGNSPAYYQSGAGAYGAATSTTTGFVYAGNPNGDLTWDWHRFGLLVTPTTVTSYFDDKPMGSQPMPQYADKSAPLWGWMINLAMGSGWPVNAPPANHYDTTCGSRRFGCITDRRSVEAGNTIAFWRLGDVHLPTAMKSFCLSARRWQYGPRSASTIAVHVISSHHVRTQTR